MLGRFVILKVKLIIVFPTEGDCEVEGANLRKAPAPSRRVGSLHSYYDASVSPIASQYLVLDPWPFCPHLG